MRGRAGLDRSAWKSRAAKFASLALTLAPWVALAAMTARAWRDRQAGLQASPRAEAALDPVALDIAQPRRGRLAESPRDIPPAGWKDVLWRTWREVGADRLTSVAGGITFYALLAIFPAIGVFVSLYGIFADVHAVQLQLAQFATVIPQQVLDIVSDQMVRLAARKQASTLAFVISLLLSVWSANAGMKALFDGLNTAYGEREKRNFVSLTALTYAFTFAALLFLTLVTALLVAVPLLFKLLGLGGISGLWIPLRWAALFVIAAGGFAAVYRYGPCRAHPRWRWVGPGGLLAAFFWLAGSLVYSFYLNSFAHYDATYGSLGAVIGFMTWIWFSVLVVLVGAEFAAQLEHQTAVDTTTGAPQPMGQRGAVMADTIGPAFRFKLSDHIDRAARGVDAGFDQAVKIVRRRRAS
jgi:membrane protein